MRTLLLILLITLISCQPQRKSKDNRNIETAWNSDKLIGKVKEMTLLKSESESSDEKTINFKKSYSYDGDLVY